VPPAVTESQADLAQAYKARTAAAKEAELATAELEAREADAKGATDDLGDSEDELAGKTKKAGDAAESGGGFMKILALAAAAVGPEFIVAGSGAAAFAAFAVPGIEQVVKSSDNMAATWGSVSDAQRDADVGIHLLIGDYKSLADSVKPEVITDFDKALDVADDALLEIRPLLDASAVAVGGFIDQFGNFVTSGQTTQFIHFLADEIGPDLHSLGNLLQGGASGVEGLTEALNPVDKVLFNVAGGLLSFIGDLSRAAPWLVDTTVLAIGASVAWGKLSTSIESGGLASAATGLKVVAADVGLVGTELIGFGAEILAVAGEEGVLAAATYGLSAALDVLSLANPFFWVAGAAVAVGALGLVMTHGQQTTAEFVAEVDKANKASGFNVTGYEKAASAFGDYATAAEKTGTALEQTAGVSSRYGTQAEGTALAVQALTQQQQQAAQQSQELTSFVDQLAIHFGITTQQAEELADTVGGNKLAKQVEEGGAALSGAMQKTIAYGNASNATAVAAANLGNNLGLLKNEYGLTNAQLDQSIKAAGLQKSAFDGSGTAAANAVGKFENWANANLHADGALKQVSTDMITFSNDTLTVTARIGGLDDAYNTLVGNFVSGETAQLQVASDMLTIASNAHQAGASMTGANQASVTLQQSFFAAIPDIESAAGAMLKQGDSAKDVTKYIGQEIDALEKQAGKSATAQEAIKALKTWEDQLSASTDSASASSKRQSSELQEQYDRTQDATSAAAGLTTETDQQAAAFERAAGTLQSDFIMQIESMGVQDGTATTATGKLITSILDTGTTSKSTAGDRAQLIADLEHAGVNASSARTDVDDFITSISKIPGEKTFTATVNAHGSWSVSESTVGAPSGHGSIQRPDSFAAQGLFVTGGVPGKDSVLIAAQQGELVVPPDMVQAGAVDHLRGKIPGFETGGYVGTAPGLGTWAGSEDTATDNQVVTATEQAATSAINSAIASSAIGTAVPGHVTGTVASWFSAGTKAAGVPSSWIPGLEEIAHYESGDNPDAEDPISVDGEHAEGIMQMLMSTFMAHHVPGTSSNIFDPVANIASASRYIQGRYGNPLATPGLISVSHGGGYQGYDDGGVLPPLPSGVTAGLNTTGQPESVLNPDQWASIGRLVAAVQQLVTTLGSANRPASITNVWNGTQVPGPEMQQAINVRMALQLSGK
jgi:SLT domain-containing protein